MNHVDLDRAFREWSDDEAAVAADYGLHEIGAPLRWRNLLDHRRVVILAEAGSGKSDELEYRLQVLRKEGRIAFLVPVEDLAALGLDGALDVTDASRLAAWKSDGAPAWFFLDSIDEALGRGSSLRDALRRLGRDLEGALDRAHVVLSSRFTAWDHENDLKELTQWLPIPSTAPTTDPAEWRDALRAALRGETSETSEPKTESPLVVLMAALDDVRIRRFAEAAGVKRTDDFLDALREAGARPIAGRPLGLRTLIDAWQAGQPLESFGGMIAATLHANLREDRRRSRRDDLDENRAMRALERIGAAMVFAKTDRIAVPGDFPALPDDALRLEDILQDWSGSDREKLLSRAVFDPGTMGRARIHCDNRGDVRSFLAARWIKGLLEANCSATEIRRLLFAVSYDLRVVKPSMRQTAAWLAVSFSWVADDIIDREPQIFLEEGDPSELGPDVVGRALRAVADRLSKGEHFGLLDNLALQRLARACPHAEVRRLWLQHEANREVRGFLLRLIWLGDIRECHDLAEAALVLDDPGGRLLGFATRALGAAGDRPAQNRLSQFVRTEAARLPPHVVWNAVDDLFPEALALEDVLAFVRTVKPTRGEAISHFRWIGPELVRRMPSGADLERFLDGLLTIALADNGAARDEDDIAPDGDLCPAIETIADRLLREAPIEDAPSVAIRAVLWVERSGSRRSRLPEERPDLCDRIGVSAGRRRRLFSIEADEIDARRMGEKGPIDSPWQLNVAAQRVGFDVDDASWLLDIALEDARPARRRLALRLALQLAGRSDAAADQIATIRARIAHDADLEHTLVEFTRPRQLRPEEEEREQRWAARRAQDEAERQGEERLWEEFVAGLRADPDRLSRASAPSDSSLTSELLNAFRLLVKVAADNSRWAISTTEPLVPILGLRAAAALAEAIIASWRGLPSPSALRGPGRRTFHEIDRIRLCGVSLEAARDPAWASRLNASEVPSALDAAFCELRLPSWVDDLAREHPSVVGPRISEAVVADVLACEPGQTSSLLSGASEAGPSLRNLIAPTLMAEVVQRNEIHAAVLLQVLEAILEADGIDRARLTTLAIEQVGANADPARVAAFARVGLTLDPPGMVDVIEARLAASANGFSRAFAEHLLPILFGDRFAGQPGSALSFGQLHWLVKSGYSHVKPEDDIRRPPGVTYSPGLRDDAQDARDRALQRLAATPGRATFEALRAWAANGDIPIEPRWLQDLALRRARLDADDEPWRARDLPEFEGSRTTSPRTSRDLQRVALGRLEDLQHDLLHGEFNIGKELKRCPREADVQNWVAQRLYEVAGRSYTTAREAHVVDEKEPDIRLTATATDATLAIEIKVPESWTIEQLDHALEGQLCGQYLRRNGHRYGILLLVYQNKRPNGWELGGAVIGFDDVLKRLRSRASEICAFDPLGPQPAIAVLDVSSVPADAKGDKAAKKKRRKAISTDAKAPGAARRKPQKRPPAPA